MAFIFHGDQRLYSDREHCLKTFPTPATPVDDLGNPRPLIYHCFWTGPLSQLHRISLNSLRLVMSEPAQIWLWMRKEDLEANQGQVPEGVKAVPFDMLLETEGTLLASRLQLFAAPNPALLSDAVRWLLLQTYGGFYFDLDMLFLKDPRPLSAWDFVYQWSDRPYGNSAMAHIAWASPVALEMHRRVLRFATPHPRTVLDFRQPCDEDLRILPVFLFDPRWIERDKEHYRAFNEFFESETPVTLQTFWPGAYAYHWHNQWNRTVTPKSHVGQLAREIDERLAQRARI